MIHKKVKHKKNFSQPILLCKWKYLYLYKGKIMGNLILSSTTVFTDWDINDILEQKSNSKNWDLERINQYNTDNTIGPYCDGLTYLEIEVLNNLQYAK